MKSHRTASSEYLLAHKPADVDRLEALIGEAKRKNTRHETKEALLMSLSFVVFLGFMVALGVAFFAHYDAQPFVPPLALLGAVMLAGVGAVKLTQLLPMNPWPEVIEDLEAQLAATDWKKTLTEAENRERQENRAELGRERERAHQDRLAELDAALDTERPRTPRNKRKPWAWIAGGLAVALLAAGVFATVSAVAHSESFAKASAAIEAATVGDMQIDTAVGWLETEKAAATAALAELEALLSQLGPGSDPALVNDLREARAALATSTLVKYVKTADPIPSPDESMTSTELDAIAHLATAQADAAVLDLDAIAQARATISHATTNLENALAAVGLPPTEALSA